jgi:ribonucleoside-diphosphate reductase alpha chain
VIPFYKLFQSAVKSCSQGGVRGGAATLYYPIWHLEIEDMLVLKNNKGTEDNRVRHMDYGVQFNKLMYERLISGGDITLFSPHDVPGLYEAFFCDQDLFKDLYETAERNTRLRKKTVKAIELFSQFMDERKNTGRVYLQNVDNANDHGSFLPELAPIRQSNLCSEIDLPTKPLNDINDGAHRRKIRIPKEKYQEYLEYKKSVNGILRLDKEKFNGKKGTQGTTMENDWLYEIVESDTNVREDEDYIYEDELVEDYDGAAISLCTLSAINWGNMRSPEDFKKVCTLAVRGLDELLDYQNYPVLAAELSTMKRRPLGIGIINFAYWLAKNGLTYQHIDKQGLALVDEWAEAWSFYLIKASADLAAERGECSGSDETKYGQGITPNQTYSKAVDELIPHKERQDWKGLRKQLKETGIRNSTLMALMPSETSAQVANATNGIEPPRNLISVKQSKHGVLKQVVPEYKKLKNKYDLLWDQQSPEGYIKIVSVLQKYIDQGISVNTSYNPRFFEEEKIPMSLLLKHLLMFYKYGGKQLYYFNTNDGQGEIDVSTMEQRIDKVDSDQDTDQDCESCVI